MRRGPPGSSESRRSRRCRPQIRSTARFSQEHQGAALANGGSPKDSPAHEMPSGGAGAYTRFDVSRPRVRRSWPSFRGGGPRRAPRHPGTGHARVGAGGGGRGRGPPLTTLLTALLLHRYAVARVIWADMLSIAVTYFITLCLFPGLESEIRHCVLGEWLPILIMAVFNLSDFVGKVGPAPPPAGDTPLTISRPRPSLGPPSATPPPALPLPLRTGIPQTGLDPEKGSPEPMELGAPGQWVWAVKGHMPLPVDPGSPARGLARHPPAGLLLPTCALHSPLHPLRVPQRRARPPPPGLALHLLAAHGHQ